MNPPKATTAYDCADGTRRHFKSMTELRKALGIAATYLAKRINSGIPCKGWLIFDEDHVCSPEAKEALRRHVKGYERKQQAKAAKKKGFVSVRIDRKTVILVPAHKWTPDYAEKYRAKMRDAQRLAQQYEPTDFINQNNHLLDRKRGGRR